MTVSIEGQPAPAKATAVSVEARPTPAKATAVSDDRPSWPTRPDCGARGRRQDPAGLRADAQAHVSAPGAAGVECAGGNCRGAGGRWQGLARQHTDTPTDWRPPRGLRGLARLRDDAQSHTSATRPHWCGGRRRDRRARAGFEARRRAKRGRLASRAAGPSGARNTRGATSSPAQPGNARRSSPSEPCARAGASRPGRSGYGPRCAAPRLRCR